MTSLIPWLAGFVVVVNFQVLHARTNLGVYLWNLFHRRKVSTRGELSLAALTGPAWKELFACGLCASQHVGALAALGILWLRPDAWSACLVGVFSWAGCASLLTGAVSPTRLPPPAEPAPAAPTASSVPAPATPQLFTASSVPAPATPQLFTPSDQATEVIKGMLEQMRAMGKEAKISPLFIQLQQELNIPQHPATRAVAEAFKAESTQLESSGCSSCDKGALLRKYMAVLHDVMQNHALLPRPEKLS